MTSADTRAPTLPNRIITNEQPDERACQETECNPVWCILWRLHACQDRQQVLWLYCILVCSVQLPDLPLMDLEAEALGPSSNDAMSKS